MNQVDEVIDLTARIERRNTRHDQPQPALRRLLAPGYAALTCTDDLFGKRNVTVELATEFHAVKDYSNFTRSPLKAGDVVRLTSFVRYNIDSDGRFARIRAGSFGEPTKNEAASLE